MNTRNTDTIQENQSQELRRGVLVLAVLSQLQEKKYGYALIDSLNAQSLKIEQGTLYPLLRRLEEHGMLVSEWKVDGSRPRRYYQITSLGRMVYEGLKEDWYDLVKVMNAILSSVNV